MLDPRCLDGVVSFTSHAITIGVVPKCLPTGRLKWISVSSLTAGAEAPGCMGTEPLGGSFLSAVLAAALTSYTSQEEVDFQNQMSCACGICMSFVAQENKY